MFVAGKKAARVLVLGIALLGAASGAHTMAEAAGGPPAAVATAGGRRACHGWNAGRTAPAAP